MSPPVTAPRSSPPAASRRETADGAGLLARLNTTFAAGLRGAGVYTRTDRQDAVFADGSVPGSRALALQPDQAFVSEMFAVGPGRHTLGLDLRGAPGTRVTARLASSWQTPDGELRRPVLGELTVTLESEDWIRIAVPARIPDDCPGVNLQIGEERALADVFAIDAPGWSTRAPGDDPVVLIDRLSLQRGDTADYAPPPVALGLAGPASPGLVANDGDELALRLTVANPRDCVARVRLAGRAVDILYGTTHPLPLPDVLPLDPGEARVVPFSLGLPAGQFLVEVTASTDTGEAVVARPATFLSPARVAADGPARSPFIGRALYNAASHESCRMLGAPSSRLLGDGMPYPLNWQVVQPAPGAFDWTDSDRFVARLAEGRIAPLIGLLNYNRRTVEGALTVLSPPEWVPAELPGPGAWPGLRKAVPVDLDLWCDYVRAVATRYRHEIRAWEVINEPGGIMDAASYVRLLRAAHRVLKAVDPGLTVVGICATGDEVDGADGALVPFLEQCLALGAAEHLDVISFHPYVWPHSPEQGRLPETLAAIKTLCDRHAPGKPLWSTEFGWNSPVIAPGRLRTERGPSRNLCAGEYTALDSANFVARGLLHHLGAGIGKIHLFNNPQPGRLHPFRANGLVLFDYDRTPLPVFLAAREVMQRLADATLVTHREPRPGVFFQLHRHADAPDRLTLVLWRREETLTAPDRIAFALPGGCTALLADVFGRRAPLMLHECHAPLSPAPAFIELQSAAPEAVYGAVEACLSRLEPS
ncbi:MAG: hypothetical protein ABII82_11935 [Verrucomicrobiota bacterium]